LSSVGGGVFLAYGFRIAGAGGAGVGNAATAAVPGGKSRVFFATLVFCCFEAFLLAVPGLFGGGCFFGRLFKVPLLERLNTILLRER
jgi:hypothetical protein